MRNLFLLLVIVNLGVLAVFSWVIEKPEPSPEYEGPRLTLLRERAPAVRSDADVTEIPEPEATAAPEESSTSAQLAAAETDLPEGDTGDLDQAEQSQPSRCVSIGPFPQLAEADAAMATLVAAGFDPSRTVREYEVWDGYWVYIEQIETTAAALVIEADLNENGINDTNVISNSDSGVLISVGMFSEIARAVAQAARISRIGYEATIADSMTTAQTHWFDVMLASEQSVALELLQTPGQISRLEQLTCSDGDSI